MLDARLRATGFELVIASFIVLFQELALIRWLGSEIRVLAYFPNVVLISAFLGLGVGCLLTTRRAVVALWPPLLVVLIVVASAMGRIVFTQESLSEHLWLLYYDLPKSAAIVHGVRIPILITFLLAGLSFVPLGHFVAARLRTFREERQGLTGYAFDLGGSLLGTIAFAAVSFAGSPPLIWFSIIGVCSLLLLKRWWAVGLASFAAIAVLVVMVDRADQYSPYYALRRIDLSEGGFLILANGSQHQYAAPLRMSDQLVQPRSVLLREGYHLPYRLLRRPPGRVLVLGAGTGNDVAVALDEGATRVDAVEIDPAILAIGKARHPDRPYSDPRVHALNTDARSFLNSSTAQYDLIVFGTLDSMTRLSALSSVRLDNFVYTRECLAAAAAHLRPGGGLALYFGTSLPYIDQRFRGMIAEVTGRAPAVIARNYGSFNTLYLGGAGFAHLAPAPVEPTQTLPSDDWPYLYLARRSISYFYLSVMAAIALIAGLSVGVVQRKGLGRFDGPMFFFGLAFLLLESKSVTEMNLVWGSTWLTSAIVFASILLMVLTGTLLMRWRPLTLRVSAGGLILSLLAAWATPVHLLAGAQVVVCLILSLLFVGTPIFFASTSFAILFRDRQDAGSAFGWNLLGAVMGGLLEFSSMVVGLRLMAIVALAAYLAAFRLSSDRSADETV